MRLREGQPYSGNGGALPEGTYYAWCGDRHELAVVQSSPREDARATVAGGDVELAFVHETPVLVILARVAGGDGWREAPFCWHLLPRSERRLPRPLRDGESAVVDLVLVRAEDGIVDAVGWMTLDPAFSWVLQRAIREEAGRPWDPLRFHHTFEALRARYPSPELLLELAVPCRRARFDGREPPAVERLLRAEDVEEAQDGDGAARSAREPPADVPPAEVPDLDDTAVSRLPEPGDGC